MVQNAVGEFHVFRDDRRLDLPVVEDAVEKPSLSVGERKNGAQGGAGSFLHLLCPAFRVVHRSEMIGSQNREQGSTQ